MPIGIWTPRRLTTTVISQFVDWGRMPSLLRWGQAATDPALTLKVMLVSSRLVIFYDLGYFHPTAFARG